MPNQNCLWLCLAGFEPWTGVFPATGGTGSRQPTTLDLQGKTTVFLGKYKVQMAKSRLQRRLLTKAASVCAKILPHARKPCHKAMAKTITLHKRRISLTAWH